MTGLFHVVAHSEGKARAGVLQGTIHTPALASYTEHGGVVPFLTRDMLLEVKQRHPASFGLLLVDLKTCLPIKEGGAEVLSSAGLNLEERMCLPAGLISCLSLRDCLSGQGTSCGQASVSMDTANGRRCLSASEHGKEVMRLAPRLATAVIDEVSGADGASKTRHVKAMERSLSWLDKLLSQLSPLSSCPTAILGGVVGGLDVELRRRSVKETIARKGLEGVVIAGLGLGETREERAAVLETVISELPEKHLRLVVGGLSSPSDVLEAVERGVDLMSSPCPYLFARSGHALIFALQQKREDGPARKKRKIEDQTDDADAYADAAVMHLWDRRWRRDKRPLVEGCECLACRQHSRAYIHHLLLAHEMLAEVLLYIHNLEHFLKFFESARRHIMAGSLSEYQEHIKNVWKLK